MLEQRRRWALLIALAPDRECHSYSCASLRPIAWNVVHQFHVEMLDGTGRRDPVPDLGVAGIKAFERQRGHRGLVLLPEDLEHVAIERLVHDEMAQPTRRDDPNPLGRRPLLDRFSNRLPEPIAPAWSRLIRRVVGIEENR